MRRPLCVVCLLFVITVFVCVALNPPKQVELSNAAEETVYLAGKVYHKESRPSLSGEEQSIIYLNQIVISDESKFLFEEQEKIQGVICYMEDGTEAPLGSIVAVKGKLQEFNQATNPGEFDSRQYYQILKLDFRLKNAEIVKMTSEYNKLYEGLYKIKKKCSCILEKYYDEVDAGIMKTILLGDKNSLAEEVEEQYKRNGIIHIMAISGLHISMLGMGLYKLLKKCRMPTWLAGCVTVLFIWCYGIMTGMSASACRAIIMFLMKIVADIIGRTYDLLTALAVAAVMLLAEQPLYVKHCGFLLSFGAVMGIGIVLPILQENLSERMKKLPGGLFSGMAVFLVSFPIQIYYYYQYPIYSIVLNLLIIPLMTFVMISGLLILGIGAVTIPVLTEAAGTGVVFVGHGILRVYSFLCSVAEKLPGSVFITGKPKVWQIVVYYAALCLFLLWKKVDKTEGKTVRKTEKTDDVKGKAVGKTEKTDDVKGKKIGKAEKSDDVKGKAVGKTEKSDDVKGKKVIRQEKQKFQKRIFMSVARGLVLGMGFIILLIKVRSGVEITFLDVGQGDCIYIRSETGKSYLIDGGSTSKSKVGEYQITPFLKSKGVSCLEAVFVTHGDKDHYSGVEELLENGNADRIRIKRLVLPETERKQEDVSGQNGAGQSATGQKAAGQNAVGQNAREQQEEMKLGKMESEKGVTTELGKIAPEEGEATELGKIASEEVEVTELGKMESEKGETTQEANATSEESVKEEGCDSLKKLAWQQGIEVVYIKQGNVITDGKLKLECLNPSVSAVEDGGKTGLAESASADKNEQSIVIYLTYGEFSALFTGDVTGEPEQEVSEQMKQRMNGRSLTVLKVAHHGSMYSTDKEFLENVRPKISVISCGKKNRYGHPHEETLERLEDAGSVILNTAESGAIMIEIDGGVKVWSYKETKCPTERSE